MDPGTRPGTKDTISSLTEVTVYRRKTDGWMSLVRVSGANTICATLACLNVRPCNGPLQAAALDRPLPISSVASTAPQALGDPPLGLYRLYSGLHSRQQASAGQCPLPRTCSLHSSLQSPALVKARPRGADLHSRVPSPHYALPLCAVRSDTHTESGEFVLAICSFSSWRTLTHVREGERQGDPSLLCGLGFLA